MPKETFFNLPETKRKKLLTAIKNELSRVPFSQFSVNKIVKEAGISRGSFYQYFHDRNDMLGYVLIEFRKKMVSKFINRLEKSDGDIFDLFIFVLEMSIDVSKNHDNGELYKNVMSDLSVNAEFYLNIYDGQKQFEDDILILPYLQKGEFCKRYPDKIMDIIYILKTLCLTALAEAFAYPEKQDEIKADYTRRLDLIKKAFERKESNGE